MVVLGGDNDGRTRSIFDPFLTSPFTHPHEQMATQLRAARHGQSVNPTGSVVSRSVRLANSMSTPWNRKSGDVFR